MGDKIYLAKQDTLLEVQQTVNQTDSTIGNIGDPAGEESLVGLVKNVPEKVLSRAVKSIQTIVIVNDNSVNTKDPQYDNKNYKDYKISTVNPDKTVVFGNTYAGKSLLQAKVVSADKVRIYAVNYGSMPSTELRDVILSVIEFL